MSQRRKTPNTASRVATRRDPVLHLRQAVCLPTMRSNLDATKNLAGRASWQLHATQPDNLLLVAELELVTTNCAMRSLIP